MLTRKNNNFFCPLWLGETKNITWVTKSHFTSLMKFKLFEQNIWIALSILPWVLEFVVSSNVFSICDNKRKTKNRIVWQTKFRHTVYIWIPLIRYMFTFTSCRTRILLIQMTMFQMMTQRTYLTLIMSLCVSLTRCRDLFLYGDEQEAQWATVTGETKRAAKPFSAAFLPQSPAGYFCSVHSPSSSSQELGPRLT